MPDYCRLTISLKSSLFHKILREKVESSGWKNRYPALIFGMRKKIDVCIKEWRCILAWGNLAIIVSGNFSRIRDPRTNRHGGEWPVSPRLYHFQPPRPPFIISFFGTAA
jgi:hypothetical protein